MKGVELFDDIQCFAVNSQKVNNLTNDSIDIMFGRSNMIVSLSFDFL